MAPSAESSYHRSHADRHEKGRYTDKRREDRYDDRRPDAGSSSRSDRRMSPQRERRERDRHSRRRSASYDGASGSDEERRRRHHRRHRYEDHDREQRRHRSHRETSEERNERKRRKKDKREQQAEDRAKAVDTLLYSSEATATNKSTDNETFRWAKKEEKDRKQGLTPAEARQRDEEKRRDIEEMREKLKIASAQREKDRREREEQEQLMARQNINELEAKWYASDDIFELGQERAAARFRVRDERARPVDPYVVDVIWLDAEAPDSGAKDLEDEDADQDSGIDHEDPTAMLQTYDLEMMKELHADILRFHALETNRMNIKFWGALLVVCDDMLSELRAKAGMEASKERVWRDLNQKLEADARFANKEPEELKRLKREVQDKLDNDNRIIVEDWLNFKRAIEVWQARAKLVEYYKTILENRLHYLKTKRRDEEERRRRLGLPSLEEERAKKAADAAKRRAEREKADTVHDAGILMAREMMAKAESDDPSGMDEDFAEAPLDDIQSASQRGTYAMDDKYRPRKPMYYNKVHTGFDWNTYNKTHYDTDNPPPKQVQGYKFNIFYPDLIDKSKPPTYRIVKEPGNDETCLLIFEAGPPYEAIGFRIVNKKWNTQPQRGFKAAFDRGTLHLWFNFQRMFYRK